MHKIIFFTLTFFYISASWACEPCMQTWDLQTTASKADLIVIGTRITPRQPEEDKEQAGPEFMDIEVSAVLKGNFPEHRIKTDGWYGMCPYGMVLTTDRSYVLYLTKQEGRDYYQPLNNGCAEKATPLSDPMDSAVDGKTSCSNPK